MKCQALFLNSFQPVLSRKPETIIFLYSLASSPAAQPSAVLLPLLTSPPYQKAPVIQQVFNDASKGGKVTVKSKATLLRDYRSHKSKLGSSSRRFPKS
jgi:gamma-tubulin complex component 3